MSAWVDIVEKVQYPRCPKRLEVKYSDAIDKAGVLSISGIYIEAP